MNTETVTNKVLFNLTCYTRHGFVKMNNQRKYKGSIEI